MGEQLNAANHAWKEFQDSHPHVGGEPMAYVIFLAGWSAAHESKAAI